MAFDRLGMKQQLKSPEFLVGVAVLAASLGLYLATIAPTLSWGFDKTAVDGGELLAAAKNFGVPHPPGYPTYTLLLKGFGTFVPVGDFAFRGNLLSAILASLSAVLLYSIVVKFCRSLAPDSPRVLSLAASALGALVLVSSPLFWSQSVITEVYTLNALFVGALILLAVRLAYSDSSSPEGGWRRFNLGIAGFGFLLGLGLGNHLTLLAIAVPMIFWLSTQLGWRRMVSPWLAIPLLIGLGIYVYLPLSAAQHPPVNWGDAQSIDGLTWMLTGEVYQEYVFAVPLSSLADRLTEWLELVFAQFNPLGIFMGVIGGAWLLQRGKAFFWMSLASILVLLVYAVSYNTVDSEVLMIPAFYVFAIWIGLGFLGIATGVASWAQDFPRRRVPGWARGLDLGPVKVAWALSIVAFLALPVSAVALNFDAQNLRNDRQAYEHARRIFDQVPDSSIILSIGEETTFSLWYMGFVEESDRDVAPIAATLLQFEWYWRDMHRRFPDRIPHEFPAGQPDMLRQIVGYNEGHNSVFFTYRNAYLTTVFDLEDKGNVYEATLK